MKIQLMKAGAPDCNIIHEMQVEAFKPLLEKYQDYITNPSAETLDRVVQRMNQSVTDYYLIQYDL